MNSSFEKSVKNAIDQILSRQSKEVQRIITGVIRAENMLLHLKKPHGIYNQIIQIVKEEVRE